MIENKKCSMCDKNDWHSLDYLRDRKYWIERDYIDLDEEVNFKICKNCGYVTYDYMADKTLESSYNKQRPVFQAPNMITGNRKNQYHKKFLEEFSFNNKTILDVGCASGDFLQYLVTEFGADPAKIYGTEYNENLRYFTGEEYGFHVSKDIDETTKYDFISYYHVLEHLQYPEEQLLKCRDLITDKGQLYLSIPFWFEELDEQSGIPCNDFENYYHINHVIVFSRTAFSNLLKKTGWKVIKEDDVMYGITVLCEKTDITNDIELEDYKLIEKTIQNHKKTIELSNNKKYDEAVKVVAAYPDAYLQNTLTSEHMKDFDKQMEIIEAGLKACPGNQKLVEHKAKILFQWDDRDPKKQNNYGNNVKLSKRLMLESLKIKPGNESLYYFIGLICARYEKNYSEGIDWLKKTMDINPTKWNEIWSMIGVLYKEKMEWEDGKKTRMYDVQA